MSNNPFDIIDARLSNIENLLLDMKDPACQPDKSRDPNNKIFGIKGLAQFVNCSEPTAVKLARSGKFHRYQNGRKIFFYESDVLKGMKR
jgi:hypothetical protein